MEAVHDGHIVAASDVFPEEPLPRDHRVRKLPGFIRSAHRAGALDVAFKRMGDMVLEPSPSHLLPVECDMRQPAFASSAARRFACAAWHY
jgi:lactate dehydrogenase-like 2-hydroxyacid dehydrogenase